MEFSILFTLFTWMAHEFELNIFKLVWISSQNQLSSMAVQWATLYENACCAFCHPNSSLKQCSTKPYICVKLKRNVKEINIC